MGTACKEVEEEIEPDTIKVIFPNGDKQRYPKPLKLSDLIPTHKSLSSPKLMALMVNGKVTSINSMLSTGIATIKPILYDSAEGFATYKRTLVQIFATAVNKLYSKKFVTIIQHGVNNGYLWKKDNDQPFTEEEVKEIKDKMNELIQRNLPIDEVELSHQEALNYFKSINHKYSVSLIETNNVDIVKCSCIDKVLTLFFRPLGATTGIINEFDVRLGTDSKNLLLLFPTISKTIPDVLEDIETKLTIESYEKSNQKSKMMNINCIGDLNKVIISSQEQLRELILTMNMHQENEIGKIADIIGERVKNGKVKFIGIAGPSASGKTTFSKKLGLLLKSLGVETIVISMDDYFVNRKDTPKDKNGNYDFECLEALRIDDFNRDLNKLYQGEAIERCVFDFVNGTYNYLKDDVLQLPSKESGKYGVVLCEGLHGIDERVTKSIPRDEKFFIYIAPLTPIKSDEYNFFSDYVLRLYRRMIRDYRTRGNNASKTLKNWFSVAKGEELYIYPFIDSSDLIWDSSLDYEVSVLFSFVFPLLRTVDVHDPYYYLASYLMDTMTNYLPISDEFVQKTAVLREFIGGSPFE
jgi:uridine kinase